MEKTKVIVLNFFSSRILVKIGIFTVFLVVSMAAPFIKIQLVTGSIVNAILFLSTLVLGIEAGILIGCLPSLVSALSGLLPVALLPMIPYIILGNAILVLTFNALRKKNFLAGIVTASFVKFLFLYLSSSLVIELFIHESLPVKIIAMMTWPQLITALVGGLIVYLIYKKR
jgi:hypothetical protein